MSASREASAASAAPAPVRARMVLASLIIVATVANLNLAVANVALPDIGRAFNASQTELDLVAVGLGLPDHPPAGRGGIPAGPRLRAGPCQRDHRSRRQPRRSSVGPGRRLAHPGHQLRPGPRP